MTNEELIVKIKSCQTERNVYIGQLYAQNRAFIYKTALHYSKNAEIDDLMQEAYIVLDEVVRNYRTDINIKFITYFGKVLRWRFSAYTFKTSTPIKMPSEYKELTRKYHQFNQVYFQSHGEKPVDEEYMRALNISQETLESLKTAVMLLNTVSFDEPLNDAEGISLQETIPADEDIEDTITESKEREYLNSCLYRAVDNLDPHKKKAITDFYFKNKSVSDTAKDLNLSLGVAHGLKTKAIRELRGDRRLYRAVIKEEHYDDSDSYRYSLGRFKRSGLSPVEIIAIRNGRDKNVV